jgi:ornithine cyclodeaminase
MPRDYPVTEFCKVVTGAHPGRRSRDEVTIFDSVGFALEDFAALRFLADRLEGTAFYSDIDLITAPVDPRNLFGLLLPEEVAQASAA